MTERGMIIAVTLMLGWVTAVSVADAQEARGGPPDQRIGNVPRPLPPTAPCWFARDHRLHDLPRGL